MGDHLAVSTQERNPWAAVRRTAVAVFALIPVVNAIAAATLDLLKPFGDAVPAWVFPALNGILVATALLAAWVTRILALPVVNDWLRRFLPALAPEGKPNP